MSRLILLLGLACATTLGVYVYRSRTSAEAQLEQEKLRTAELRQVVERLTAERRVADVIVTDQRNVNGALRTELLFVEYARDGSPLPGKRFALQGKMVHLDAMVVKFDGKFVERNDALRGHSVALFTRIYGDQQSPAQAFPIDEPGRVPDVYQSSDPGIARFQQQLWRNFWRLADDPAYRNEMGVRVAQGEGLWRPFEPDHLYTITLESNGGLNIRSEPIKGIYREALKAGSAVQ